MKSLLPVLVVLVCAFSPRLYTQAEATNWHFGQMRALTFQNGQPIATSPSSMLGFEGVVSMSDSTGQLLFYTNAGGFPAQGPNAVTPGIIWNRNHEVLYDMRGEEGGGWSARQSSIAMPDPAGEPGVYYLFTMEESGFDDGGAIANQPLGRGLSYFIIDMQLNDGLGGVRLADQRVFVPAYEGLDATPATEEAGYWIACHQTTQGANDMVIVPLTATGVGEPVIFSLDNPVRGRIKFSPDGKMLYNNGFIYAFDPATGTLGGTIGEVGDVIKNTVTFTPDSRYLYGLVDDLNIGLFVARYAVTDQFARQPLERLSNNESTDRSLANGPIQIGPNDKLYYLEFDANGPEGEPIFGLSEIECYSSPEPTVNRFVLAFPEVSSPTEVRYNLPAYVDAIFARPFSPDTLVLDTARVLACVGSLPSLEAVTEGTAFSWSTGDTTATLAVGSPDLYCVTITGGCQPTVECTEVDFDSIGVSIELIEEDRGCEGDFVRAIALTEGRIDSLRWDTGEGTDTIVKLETPPSISFSVEVFGPCGSASATVGVDSILPRFAPRLRVSTGSGEVCPEDSVRFFFENPARDAIASYDWFDGSTLSTLDTLALEETDYFVAVTSECGDTVDFDFDFLFAEGCNCEAVVPDVITPNGDGRNDGFRLFTNCAVLDFTLTIYNRWGQEVFTTNQADRAWDGMSEGSAQNPGAYLYRMAFRYDGQDVTQTLEGQFMLIR